MVLDQLFDELLEGTLAVDIILWLIGTVLQRRFNAPRKKGTEPEYTTGNLPWTYLFGVRPRIEKVYVMPAFALQVPALLHLVLGGIALWLDGGTAYLIVTIICWPLIPLAALGREMLRMRKEMDAAKAASEMPEPLGEREPTGKQGENETN